jgi:hypothetical protein
VRCEGGGWESPQRRRRPLRSFSEAAGHSIAQTSRKFTETSPFVMQDTGSPEVTTDTYVASLPSQYLLEEVKRIKRTWKLANMDVNSKSAAVVPARYHQNWCTGLLKVATDAREANAPSLQFQEEVAQRRHMRNYFGMMAIMRRV